MADFGYKSQWGGCQSGGVRRETGTDIFQQSVIIPVKHTDVTHPHSNETGSTFVSITFEMRPLTRRSSGRLTPPLSFGVKCID
ncbi:hypothetical protein JCM39068_05080 [Desulfocastanea catecholica]